MHWTIPHPIQTWANAHKEKPAHGRWFDLFFDLLFVGVAFNVGHLLAHLLHDQTLLHSLLKSLAVFFVLFSAWLQNVKYYGRFDTNDTFHKLLDVVEFTSVGVAAFHAGGIADHHGSVYQATGMAVGMWINSLVNTVRCAELTRSTHANVAAQAITFLQTNGLSLSLIMLAIGIGLDNGEWQFAATENVILFVLVLAAAVPVVTLFTRVLCRSSQWQTTTVPVHISFFCHRVGEFMMLMLGESVLTCSTLKVRNEVDFWRKATWCPSALCIAFLVDVVLLLLLSTWISCTHFLLLTVVVVSLLYTAKGTTPFFGGEISPGGRCIVRDYNLVDVCRLQCCLFSCGTPRHA